MSWRCIAHLLRSRHITKYSAILPAATTVMHLNDEALSHLNRGARPAAGAFISRKPRTYNHRSGLNLSPSVDFIGILASDSGCPVAPDRSYTWRDHNKTCGVEARISPSFL